MVEESADRSADEPVYGQFTVEQETEDADDVSWLNSGRADLESAVLHFQSTQRSR